MKIAIACFSLLAFSTAAFGQNVGSADRQIIVAPNAELPEIAKKSGLGGRVIVYVTVDAAGNVLAVADNATGPDWVCPAVVRPDVVALREAARAAAANAKFVAWPDVETSRVSVTVDFPAEVVKNTVGADYSGPVTTDASKAPDPNKFTVKGDSQAAIKAAGTDKENQKFTVKGDLDYSASNAPPPVYEGPVSTTSSGNGKTLSGGVVNGRATVLPRPAYPPAAHAVRASGAVQIQVLIDTEGKVFSARPVAGHPLLRMSSRLAACGAEFSPTILMGKPVKVSGIITYNFVP